MTIKKESSVLLPYLYCSIHLQFQFHFLAIIAAVFNVLSLMMSLLWLAIRSRLIYRGYCNYLLNQALCCCVRGRDITSHVYKHKTCWFYLTKRALDAKLLFHERLKFLIRIITSNFLNRFRILTYNILKSGPSDLTTFRITPATSSGDMAFWLIFFINGNY